MKDSLSGWTYTVDRLWVHKRACSLNIFDFFPPCSQFIVGFPTGRDSATFRDSGTGKTFLSRDKGTTGQKFLHCPGTKGQRDKLKILPRDGTGQDFLRLSSSVPGHPAGQNYLLFCPIMLFSEQKTRKISFFLFVCKIEPICHVGRPGTEDLVPGFLLLLLSHPGLSRVTNELGN